jgi:O-antigen/teichoic acid export membrane protein
MPRARQFTYSVALGFLGQAIVMTTGLWLTPFLLHRLGPQQFGLWIVGQQLLVYLTLLDIGVIALLPRETAYASGRDHAASELPRLIARTFRIVLLQTPLVGVLAALVCWWVSFRWRDLRTPVAMAAIPFVLLFPTRIFRAVLEGLQDLAFIGWSYLGSWAIGLAVTVAMILSMHGLTALAAGWAVSQLLDATVCFTRLRLRFPHTLQVAQSSEPRPSASGSIREQFSRGLWVSVSQIAQVLIYGTDAAIVGRLFGAAAVVPYTCTGKLIGVLSNQPQHIIRAAEPGLSQMRVQEGKKRLAEVTGTLSLAMLLASGMVVSVALAVNPSFVRWWVGPRFYSGLLLTLLFALSMALRHLNITAIYTLFAFGHERLIAITNLTDGVLSTVFSIFLAWRMHSPVGVVLGSILSTACVLLFGNARKLAGELGVPLRDLVRPLGGWFWRMLVAGGAACLIGAFLTGGNPVQIALAGALAAAIYTALMFPVAFNSGLRPYIVPRLEALRARCVGPRLAEQSG